MRIMGIDCGSAIMGWAVLDANLEKVKLVSCGIIETHKLSREDYRLAEIGSSTAEILAEFHPDVFAVEDIFFFKNAKTVIKVAQARGVAIYEAAKLSIPVESFSPLQVKQQITGYGRASKQQIFYVINEIFKLNSKITQDDTIDAIAVAYCQFLNRKT